MNLDRILTHGNKNLPHGTQAVLQLGSIPGTMTINLKLPGQKRFVAYPNLPIRDGAVTLPVPLVFLCHAKEDVVSVRELADTLLDDGVLTWFDEKDLLPGDNWRRKITKAMKSADFVLVFLSSKSVSKTGFYQRELKLALEQRELRPEGARFIVPILLDKCDPPESLEELHWLRADHEGWYPRLKAALVIDPF